MVTDPGAGSLAAAGRRVGSRSRVPGCAAQTPLVSARGRGGRGRGRGKRPDRASRDRGTTRGALMGTLRAGPGAPALRVPIPGPSPGPFLRGRGTQVRRPQVLHGVHLPRFLRPRPPLPGEGVRGAREWGVGGSIFGAVIGICQGDRERTDGKILFSLLSGVPPKTWPPPLLSLGLRWHFRTLGCLPSRNAEPSRRRVQGPWLEFARSRTLAALVGAEILIRDPECEENEVWQGLAQGVEEQARGHSRAADLHWDCRWSVGDRKAGRLPLGALGGCVPLKES